jgi:hypothetical protein
MSYPIIHFSYKYLEPGTIFPWCLMFQKITGMSSDFVSSCIRGADKSLVRPTSLSVVFSVQGTGGSPTGLDPENRVGDQGIGSPGRPVSSGLQVPGEPFPSW